MHRKKVEEDFQTPDEVRIWTHVVEQHYVWFQD